MDRSDCPHCGRQFDSQRAVATHRRWCYSNPGADLRKRALEQRQLRSSFGSTSVYSGVSFPSRTEAAFAEILDRWGVEWEHWPDPIPYADASGRSHLYYADFYSPDRGRYYEPGQLSPSKRRKLSAVTSQTSASVSVFEPRQVFSILAKERSDG